MKALRAFVEYANGIGAELAEQDARVVVEDRHGTGRDPSLRLRWRVLQRDSFKCCACGSSPAIALGVELHVDHVFPWEEGGETVIENLQTLCSKCNLGKSNLLPA
jgi:5-methylcytosine-specific restriction endonuclease McrA